MSEYEGGQPGNWEHDNPEGNPDKNDNLERGEEENNTINDFKVMMESLNVYNEEYSAGKAIGRAMGGAIAASFGEDEADRIKEKNSEDRNEQEMRMEILGMTESATLANLGLGLEVRTQKDLLSSKANLTLEDGEKVLHFLSNLKAEDLKNESLKKYLSILEADFAKQVANSYKENADNPSNLILHEDMQQVLNQYVRFGLGETEENVRLGSYLAYAKDGVIDEYLQIESKGFLKEPGRGFGPADWIKDANAESLTNIWLRATESLSMLLSNPKAERLFEHVKAHLNSCVETSYNQVDELSHIDEKEKAEYKDVLKAAKSGIEKLNWK